MTSWGGTSQATMRREILTILSIGQKIGTSPGPLSVFSTRPRRKTTPRSYSRKTLRQAMIQKKKITTPIIKTCIANSFRRFGSDARAGGPFACCPVEEGHDEWLD